MFHKGSLTDEPPQNEAPALLTSMSHDGLLCKYDPAAVQSHKPIGATAKTNYFEHTKEKSHYQLLWTQFL
jgi:hypothetical protein